MAGRVADEHYLRLYLYTVLDDGALRRGEVERVLKMLGDAQTLRAELDALPVEAWRELMDRLVDYREQFEPAAALTAARVWLELLPRLPDDSQSILTGRAPSRTLLRTLLHYLLASEPDAAVRAEHVDELYRGAPTLWARLRLLQWFGVRQDPDQRRPEEEMLDTAATARLWDDLRERVRRASPDELLLESYPRTLLGLLLDVDEAEGRNKAAQRVDHEALALAVLGDATPDEWQDALRVVGADAWRERVERLLQEVDRDTLEERGAHALDRAERRLRGEPDPRDLD